MSLQLGERGGGRLAKRAANGDGPNEVTIHPRLDDRCTQRRGNNGRLDRQQMNSCAIGEVEGTLNMAPETGKCKAGTFQLRESDAMS